ncbi:DUF3560 domain-containing protein [Streptomyces sp. ASQP_92]|uniref:DUF3560 domain-containing protein n=1 Tax=Streptomyces sp. ASQP_92 TaxID=2979116 RepID=UPI0021C1EA94|nr:DUF3560 domain-containing protein [Streptomyces sp. ASQP_92]MCT9093450.1 DUF3560 domain-containing protein [Streptomyces sp. ASQP_92]
MITITHTHAEGTLADGTSKGDGSGDVLKRYGFRWMPSIGMYGIPGTIDRAATDLRAAGFDTELSVDDTPRPYDIVQAAARRRLDERRAAIGGRADRLAQESAALLRRSDELVDGIPMGQPIFSGKRGRWHRKAQTRAADAFLKAGAAGREAERQADRVQASLNQQERRATLQVTARRIARLERELRTIERALTGPQDGPPAGGLRAEQLRAERAVAEIQLAGDRSVLEQARGAGGFGQWSRDTLHVGDRVQIRGEWRRIVRSNVKTVSVDTGYSWVSRYGFEEITQAACPHPHAPDAPEAQTGAVRSPKPRRSTRHRPAGVSRADTQATTCADGALYVQITCFLLAGPAVRLICGCGGKHWSRALDGSHTTAAAVPATLVESLIAAEGYQVSGDWADHKVTGEWAHTARRAPVQRFIQPGNEPSAGVGELLHHWRADRWSLKLADGSAYEITWVPEGPDHFQARRRGSTTSLGAAPSWPQALRLIRAHAAPIVPGGEG